MRRLAVTAAAALAALAAGCGGAGADTPAPPVADPLAAVPDSAVQSESGLVSYLKTLTAQTPEDRSPAALPEATLPASDNAQPEPLG